MNAPIDFVTLQIFGAVQKSSREAERVDERGLTVKQLLEVAQDSGVEGALLSLDVDIDVGKALGLKEEDSSKREDEPPKPTYIP